MSENHSRALRSKIQNAIEQAQEERKRELFRQRVEIARTGIRQFDQKNIQEAVNLFYTYIRILEEWKGVHEGGLTPAHFNMQLDIHELLLLSGIYWDLAKLYDRTKTKERYTEFAHYLNQFVAFSKGMPFQSLCAESLRKYISNDKPIHKDDFKRAYVRLTDSKCFVATALMEEISGVGFVGLQNYRDEVLLPTFFGRLVVAVYYRVGPWLAALARRLPKAFRSRLGNFLDQIGTRHRSI